MSLIILKSYLDKLNHDNVIIIITKEIFLNTAN